MKTQEILTYTNTKGESITFGVGSRYHVNVSLKSTPPAWAGTQCAS